MGNWNSCQRYPRSVTACSTLIWISIYFCIYFGFPVIYHHFTTIFTAFWYIFHVFNARNDRFSSCISRLRHTFRPNHPKKSCDFNLPRQWHRKLKFMSAFHGFVRSWRTHILISIYMLLYRPRFQFTLLVCRISIYKNV